MTLKIERINSNMQREISYIIANEVKNPNVKFVTITDVDIAEFQKAIEPLYTNNDLGFSAGLKDRLFKELNE